MYYENFFKLMFDAKLHCEENKCKLSFSDDLNLVATRIVCSCDDSKEWSCKLKDLYKTTKVMGDKGNLIQLAFKSHIGKENLLKIIQNGIIDINNLDKTKKEINTIDRKLKLISFL